MASFRERLRGGEPLVGCFLRTPSPILCEMLARGGLDMICVDAEHAPFGRVEIDVCVMALRAANVPAIVRIPSAAPEHILNALDAGATGVMVPHVTTATQAQAIARFAHFGPDGRGYAGSTRAGGYGAKAMDDHLRDSAAQTTVIAQIEDAAALDKLDEIAAVDGIDGLFVGRMDLTVSLGCAKPDDARVVDAVRSVCRVAKKHRRAVGVFVSSIAESAAWLAEGATFFISGSDHGFIVAGARMLREDFAAARGKAGQ